MSEAQNIGAPTKVLVIRFSSMGDVILTTPVIRALHAMLEGEVEVHYLTKASFVEAVEGLAGIHKVWTIDRTTAEVEAELVKVGFHYVVDLHANARSAFVKRALRQTNTLDLTVDKRSLAKILLVRFGWDRLEGQHVVERYLATLAPFGSALSALGGAEDRGALELPGRYGPGKGDPSRRVALALGAAHVGKTIPESHWRKVVSHLAAQGRGIDLMGGKPESAVAEGLVSAFPDADIASHCGKAAWKETFALIGKAAALVTGDTGAMHAGAALQVPMVVVWGCTSPDLGMGPWMPHPETVELEPESPKRRRPCSRLGDRCRHKVRCPERVAPERIIEALDGILSRTTP